MIFHYMKDRMMFVQSLIGIVIIKKDSIKNSQIEEQDSQDSLTGRYTHIFLFMRVGVKLFSSNLQGIIMSKEVS